MIRFVKQHALLSLAFVLFLGSTLFFLTRFAVATLVWSDPARLDQPVEGWMTPRYLVRSWRVSPEVIAAALDLEHDRTGRRVTLAELATMQGRDLDHMIDELEAAIAEARSGADD